MPDFAFGNNFIYHLLHHHTRLPAFIGIEFVKQILNTSWIFSLTKESIYVYQLQLKEFIYVAKCFVR